ncbi:MAG: heavy metal translocating P-type ATPase [Longimicrobiales bacterium]
MKRVSTTAGSSRGEAPGGIVCTLRVGGMDCSSCAESVEKGLLQLEGVEDVRVDVVGESVTVEHTGKITRGDLTAAIDRIGYRVKDDAPVPREVSWWERRGRLVLAALSGLLWILSLTAEHALHVGPLAAALAMGAIAAGGRYIIPRGIRAAMSRALDMNFLMSIAAFGALLIGEYIEAASAMFLFALAQLLESYSMDRTRNAIKALMDLSPAEATVFRAGREVRLRVDQVQVGETVVVRPGEKIAVDGEVLAGTSNVNQAPITGEAMPAEKVPGSEVFAGTLNGEGALEVRSTKPASDTTLARIIHTVEEAQASRAPSQSFVDHFARIYTPAVVAAAIAVAVLPPLAGSGAWGEWFYRALVLLVVACPCALVISTPVTIVSALAGAAREGILIKGGLHLENAGRATVIAIDKTGTLTQGEPAVIEVVGLNGTDPREVLSLAAAAEARSEHPIARAILRRAEEARLTSRRAAATTALPGRGLCALTETETVYVGNERLFRQLGGSANELEQVLRPHEEEGRTAVLVGKVSTEAGRDARPVLTGVIAIADRLRPMAAQALRDLHRAGIERIVMLTGDNTGTAKAVAHALGGVDEFRAELLPEDKVAAVKELRRGNRKVLMVGDGVNDAPALAAADVGVAMGTAGTDVALETADIALMSDDLSKLPVAITFARRAERIIRANIVLSLLTKAAFVVLAVLGVATLWMAVLADMGASLLVIVNGLRALRAE